MGMHERASRKYHFSTKYSESMDTNNKLYSKAVVNKCRIHLKLSKALSEHSWTMALGA